MSLAKSSDENWLKLCCYLLSRTQLNCNVLNYTWFNLVSIISIPDEKNCPPPYLLAFISQHGNENILMVCKERVVLQDSFNSCLWTWLETSGKCEHEEEVWSPILDGGVGFDVEVVGNVEVHEERDDLFQLGTRFPLWHVLPMTGVIKKQFAFNIFIIYTIQVPDISGTSGQPSGMQGGTYRGSCNLWRSVSCLNSNPQLVKETLVSWETIKDLSSNWLDLARHWRECHDGFQPNILDNLLPNWTRPSIRSRCRSIEFLLASQNVFLPRKQARDTKILISPDGAWEKAHLDAGDTPLADTPHPARVEWLEEHLFLASFNREKFCLTWMDSSVNWSSITSQNPAHTTPLLHLFNSKFNFLTTEAISTPIDCPLPDDGVKWVSYFPSGWRTTV